MSDPGKNRERGDIGEDALKCKKLALPSTGSPLEQLTFNF